MNTWGFHHTKLFFRPIIGLISVGIFLASTTLGLGEVIAPYVLYDDSTGGDCVSMGATWDPSSKTCTLNSDLNHIAGIIIADGGITLDGNGHSLTGPGILEEYTQEGTYWGWCPGGGYCDGISIIASDVTVKNLTVKQFVHAIDIIKSRTNIINNKLELSPQVEFNSDNLGISYGVVISTPWGQSAVSSNQIKDNVISGYQIGISLSNSHNNQIETNRLIANYYGIGFLSSSYNLIQGNYFSDNAYAFWADPSNYNTFNANTVVNNGNGIYLYSCSSNTFSDNDFINNVNQASQLSGTGNVFDGNFWGDWSGLGPYVFSGGEDGQPSMTPNTCTSGKPSLFLSRESVRWDSFEAYLARLLTVGYVTGNRADVLDALNVTVVGSVSIYGVTAVSPLPISLGDIGAEASKSFTLRYDVPQGVGNFRTTSYVTAQDSCGYTYSYPAPYPGG